jgi:hypothetical protein
MGFDLTPRNKKIKTFYMSSFAYAWMLDSPVGWIVGYSKGITPASYISYMREDKCDLMQNDGGKVSAKEAKEMSKMARLLVENQKRLQNEFNKLDETTKQIYQENKNGYYNLPVREDFIQKIKDFADFAEKSGGFRVY